MITLSKNIRVVRKEKVSDYKIANFKVLGDSGNKKIGGSIKAENAMLVNVEELRSYLPNILGVSPTAPEWGRKLDDYVRSIAVPVDPTGNDMEIGFVFDITDYEKKDAIAELVKDESLEKDEKAIVAHITKNIHRNYWWKYGRPIEPADYFLWRYMQNYRKVANSMDEADKSLHINFYIVDSEDVKKQKSEAFKLKSGANKAYFTLSDDIDKVKTVLFALKEGASVLAAGNDDEELLRALDTIKDVDPAKFIKAATNVDKLKDAAFIEECISRNIFNRLPNTEIIIDNDTGDTLGNSVLEAIAYLKADENAKYVNTVRGRIKSKTL